ncbi:MAG: transmembrane anchor protein [Aquisalinus sp.]|nr:transmembrane anchor protein [Aquisalinus sp.]
MFNSKTPDPSELPSTTQLLKSTAIAAVTAFVLLITTVLPAEYGIDPTGIGRLVGLKKMGEIKQQLHEEAEAENIASASLTVPELDNTLENQDSSATEVGERAVSSTQMEPPQVMVAEWQDERVLTLAPDAAAEIKLTMKKGASAEFEWSTLNGHLNYDLHGDGKRNQSISYERGRAVESDSGEVTAAFDGSHGWFWRNRSGKDVTLTLRVRGNYSEIKRVL